MRTLNLARPYATVCGGALAHRFEQDGLKFDANGQQCDGGVPMVAVDDGAAASILPPPSNATVVLAAIAEATTLLARHADDVIEELVDCSDDLLRVLAALESAGKARKSVLAAIATLSETRATAPAAIGDQVDSQLEG